MPRIEPFKGLRYDAASVRLSDVIAPPYDVVGSNERTRLASRSPNNAILVELPEPDLVSRMDRYAVAADLVGRWRSRGLLCPDKEPSLYPYRMTTPDGRMSTGFIGALALGETGTGDVLPHEQTMPKPRSDRLDLLRATRVNTSPIWGLSLATGLTGLLRLIGDPVGDAVDDDGVRHQLWVMDDEASIQAVREKVSTAPVVIADGHHRYETALTYRRERRADASNAAGPYDAVMALVVELSDEQLQVGPIHRAISGLPAGFDVAGAFASWFDVVRAGPASHRTLSALEDARSITLVTPDSAYLLFPTAEAAEAAEGDTDSNLVALVLDELPEHVLSYRNTRADAVAAVSDEEAQAALLLRPVTVEQIAEWAAARRKMPPKTSYFWPKPRTGMVFRSLDD
jgi:uncharacterized protein (DUF1015 family)